ncbi:hypothetical protein [Streptomyces huasconensis]|uniref:hypothetical protein n=1 Tax=Streptomyces huasconensis TaxID=1854574 RepID=UPI0033E6D0FF
MPPCATCAVPVLTQFASPELVGPIVYEDFDRAADPAWCDSGAAALDDYARWCGHLCGLTCFRMFLGPVLGPSTPPLFELRDGALKYGAYTEAGGEIRGMVYAPFAVYAREVHGVGATVHRGDAAAVARVPERGVGAGHRGLQVGCGWARSSPRP